MSKTKRLLSLILALATVFALFAGVTAFADETATTDEGDTTPIGKFTDVTWANPYAEAIAVLNAAEITTGTSTETFGPKEKVTREQMAAFIARTGLGKSSAEILIPADTGFSDVARDNFYSKYIAWAVSQGAINGYWDEATNSQIYNPKGEVTGIQVLKMIEGILNVNEVATLSGPQWETNTISYAIKLGLLDGMQVEDYSAPATREEVAQYLLNALSAPGYENAGYSTSVNGWELSYGVTDGYNRYPLYQVNGLNRHQTENTTTTDDGTVDPEKIYKPVTPYGELFYRWEHTVPTGTQKKGITSWRHDDKNEKIVTAVGDNGVIVANPESTASAVIGTKLSDVRKVWINGAIVSATATNSDGGYVTVPALAQQALGYVLGDRDVYGRVRDETWTGATIKVYEQRFSPSGYYNNVTGAIDIDIVTGTQKAGGWLTYEFDGKADKVIVTSEYLGTVDRKDPVSGAWTIALDDSGLKTNTKWAGRSLSSKTDIGGVYGAEYALDDVVRVTPKLQDIPAYTYSGMYTQWFAKDTAGQPIYDYVNYKYVLNNPRQYKTEDGDVFEELPWWNYNGYNDSVGKFTNPGAAIARGAGKDYDVIKPETKTIVPQTYKYSYFSDHNSQQGYTKPLGHYTQTTAPNDVTWISGTYQEVLRDAAAELFADGTKYTVYLDANGYILGGFSLSGGEYAVLGYPYSNENSRISTWNWVTNKGSALRSMAYYFETEFKTYNGALTKASQTETNSWADVYNGVLKAGVTPSTNGEFVKIGTVARIWGNYGKILHGTEITDASGAIPSDGALYVQVTLESGTNRFIFTALSLTDAASGLKRAANRGEPFKVYQYIDWDHTTYIDDYTVYVIDYTYDPIKGWLFVPQNLDYDGSSTNTTKETLKFTATQNDDATEAVKIDPVNAKATIEVVSFLTDYAVYNVHIGDGGDEDLKICFYVGDDEPTDDAVEDSIFVELSDVTTLSNEKAALTKLATEIAKLWTADNPNYKAKASGAVITFEASGEFEATPLGFTFEWVAGEDFLFYDEAGYIEGVVGVDKPAVPASWKIAPNSKQLDDGDKVKVTYTLKDADGNETTDSYTLLYHAVIVEGVDVLNSLSQRDLLVNALVAVNQAVLTPNPAQNYYPVFSIESGKFVSLGYNTKIKDVNGNDIYQLGCEGLTALTIERVA